MATKQLEKSTQRRHKFFTSQNQGFTSDAIYIPDSPLFLKNNCKEGTWQLGVRGHQLREQAKASGVKVFEVFAYGE